MSACVPTAYVTLCGLIPIAPSEKQKKFDPSLTWDINPQSSH